MNEQPESIEKIVDDVLTEYRERQPSLFDEGEIVEKARQKYPTGARRLKLLPAALTLLFGLTACGEVAPVGPSTPTSEQLTSTPSSTVEPPLAPTVETSVQPRPPTSWQKLAELNNLPDPGKIHPGQSLNIPDGTTYVVKSGDTLANIAREYNAETIVSKESEPSITPTETPTRPSEEFLQPEVVHNVRVFGLKEKIATEDKIDKLYQHFDEDFDKKVPDELKNASRFDQRDRVLPRDKRYAEFVVTQSAYDAWERENGVDYVSWVKLHIDLLNRACQNAKPPATLTTEVLRVVVIQDNFANNPSRYSKDMDGTWFNNLPKVTSAYYWNYSAAADGSVVFYPLDGDINSERAVRFPPSDDSFRTNREGRVDCGTTHELSHQILNLPDEYHYDYDLGESTRIRPQKFYFATGSFHEPLLSPNLAYILRYHQNRRIRGCYTDLGGLARDSAYDKTNTEKPLSYALRPNQCNFEIIKGGAAAVRRTEIFRARQDGDYRSKKYFLETPDQVSESGTFTLDSTLFTPREWHSSDPLWPYPDGVFYPLNWIIKSGEDSLCLPEAAFVMSKIAGKDQASYRVEFSGYDDPSKKTQIVRLVDESYIDEFFNKCSERKEQFYAKMKVDGTNTWFVWFLGD